MNKILFAVSISLILFSCKSGKSKFDDPDAFVVDESYYDGSEYEYDSTEVYDESYEDYEGFEGYDEPKVRGIYNSSRTLLTDLIHTKVEVSFDWEKSQMKGKATITAKQHFYASDSLILDAR